MDKVIAIIDNEWGLPKTRAYEWCIFAERIVNKESNTNFVQENWESFDKFNTYIKWRQTEDTSIAEMIPCLKAGANGLKIIQGNSN